MRRSSQRQDSPCRGLIKFLSHDIMGEFAWYTVSAHSAERPTALGMRDPVWGSPQKPDNGSQSADTQNPGPGIAVNRESQLRPRSTNRKHLEMSSQKKKIYCISKPLVMNNTLGNHFFKNEKKMFTRPHTPTTSRKGLSWQG